MLPRRFLFLSACLLLFGFACSLREGGRSPEQQLDDLIQASARYWWSQYPETATRLGIHDFDDRLAQRSPQAIREQIAQLQQFLEVASPENLPENRLTLDGQVDRRLLVSDLRVKLFELRDLPRYRRDPTIYVPFQALNELVTDESRPALERAPLLEARLEEIPRVLREARENLENPPRLFTETAISQSRRLIPYYRDTIPEFAAQVPEFEQALKEASQKATDSLREFVSYLQDELLERSTGPLGVGRDNYDFYLREMHLLDDDSRSLLAKGERWFKETQQMLEEIARQIDPSKNWHEITEEIRADHPTKEGLLDAYCQEIQAARKHVLDNDLLTIPGPEEVRCSYTPPSQRAFSPFGTFSSPGPFDESKIGHFILHPIPDGLTPEEEEARLRAHDYTWIQVIAPHESYPGHHVQALKAQQNPRLLRKIYHSPLFSEGWGLYCEELMYETGFFRKPQLTRLTQLRLRLWRAARVLLDIQLHTGEKTYEEAQKFLVDQVGFDPAAAPGEVNIYAFQPAYVISYIVGFNEIMDLRQEMQKRQGSEFSLKRFHDDLLDQGSLPFALMRRLMLER